MNRLVLAVLLGSVGLDAAAAAERLDFFRVRHGFAQGAAKKGVARVHSQVDRSGPEGMAGPIGLYQVARLARAAGESEFVVVKSNCGTLTIAGAATSSMCDIKARFGAAPAAGDEAPPMSVSETLAAFEGNPAFFRPY